MRFDFYLFYKIKGSSTRLIDSQYALTFIHSIHGVFLLYRLSFL